MSNSGVPAAQRCDVVDERRTVASTRVAFEFTQAFPRTVGDEASKELLGFEGGIVRRAAWPVPLRRRIHGSGAS